MSQATAPTVRAVTEADIAALAQLLSDFNGMPTTAEQLQQRLDRSRDVEHPVIAYVEGAAAGFASLRLHYYLGEDVPYAELSELYVDAAYRRRGVARALVEALEAEARSAGATSWTVLTGDDNTMALAFYAQMGFAPFSVALQKWFTDERPYRISEDAG